MCLHLHAPEDGDVLVMTVVVAVVAAAVVDGVVD